MNLPIAIEVEKAAIGYALLDPTRTLDVMRGFLEIDDFSLESHKRIWRRITGLYDAGKQVDQITVYQELSAHGEATQDTLTYLTTVGNDLPMVPEISGYLDRLREATLRRRIIFAAQHIALRAADEVEPIDEVLSAVQTMAVDVTQSSAKNTGPISTHEMIASEGIDKLLAPRQHGSIRLPWKDLDRALGGLSGGQMVVVMAETSRGKTSLALQMATAAALQGKTPVVWTMEMNRQAMFQKAVTQLSGVWSIKRNMIFQERDAVNMASMQIDEYPVFLDSDARSVGTFVAGLRRVRARSGLGLAVVDHLQLIRSSRKSNRVQEVSENSRSLKLAAMDLNIPFVVLSQVDRSSVKGDGQIGLHSAKESGDIENDADVVLWVQSATEFSRDCDTSVSLHIGKQREGPAGFSIPMVFRPSSQTFLEVTNEA